MKQQAISSSHSIDASWTVNDAIRVFPETVTVFNAFGVDSCCGGAATLEEAALDASADPGELISALRIAAGGTGNPMESAK